MERERERAGGRAKVPPLPQPINKEMRRTKASLNESAVARAKLINNPHLRLQLQLKLKLQLQIMPQRPSP
jgi:hypothetical protein